MAAAWPSDTELEERGECDSTIELFSDDVEEISLGERRMDGVLSELREEGGCHEKSDEDWKSIELEDIEDIMDIENLNTEYFNYINIE